MNNYEEEKKEEHYDASMLPTTLQQQQLSTGQEWGQEWEPMPLVVVAGPSSSMLSTAAAAAAVSNSAPSSLTVWKRMHEQDPARQQVVVKIAQLLLSACLLQSENNSHDIQAMNVQQQQQQQEQQHVLFILPHVSKLLEQALYMDAPTLHEYRNEQTLIQRLLNVGVSCLTTTTTSTTIIPFSLPRLLNWMMEALEKKYDMTKQQQSSHPIPDNNNNKQPGDVPMQESNSQQPAAQATSPSIPSVLPHQHQQKQAIGIGQQSTSPEQQQQQPSSAQPQQPKDPTDQLLPTSALLLSQQISSMPVQTTTSRKRPPQQLPTVNPAQQSSQPPLLKQKKPRVKPPPPPGPKPNKKQPPLPSPPTPPSPGAAASAVVATTDATLKHHPSPTAEHIQQEEEDQQIQQLFLSQSSRQKLTRALFDTLVKESPPSDDPQWNQELYEWAKGVEDECYQSAKSHTEYTKSIQFYLRRYRIQCLVSKPDSIGADFDNLPDKRKSMVNAIIELLAEESLATRSNPLNLEDCMAKAIAIEERLHASPAESNEQSMDVAALKHRIEQITVELANSSNEEVAVRRILSSQDENDTLSSLADCRKQMIREIIHLILHAAEPSPPIKDILKTATSFEERLYNSFVSKKEYSDVTTLKDRLERLGAGFPTTVAAAAKPLDALQCDQSNNLYSILNQDADLVALPQPRKKMIYEIIRLLVKTEKAPSDYSDYQDMVERVKFFELHLYKYAQSKQEYTDAATLPDRLKSLKTMFAVTNITHSTAAAAAAASKSVNVANPAVDDTKFGIGPGDRETMINKLDEIFLQADGGAETPKQKRTILAKARYFEKRLYAAAKSKEEYFAMDTLKDRLERNAIEIAQATIAKRSSASGESSTNVVTNPPWQSSTSSAIMATNRRLKDAPSSSRKSSTSNAIKAANAQVHVIDLTLEDSPPSDRHSSGNELTKPTSTTSTTTMTSIS